MFFTFFGLIAISVMSRGGNVAKGADNRTGDNVKGIIVEDVDEGKASNLERVEKSGGKTISAEEAAIFPVTT